MRRDAVELWFDAAGVAGTLVAHGHWGRPVLLFPAEAGRATDLEDNGLVDAVRWLVDEGRVKLYCVDSFDAGSWSDRSLPLEERARRHGAYEHWLLTQVVPWIHTDCAGPLPIVAAGPSLGGFHAVNLALRRADLFPVAIGLSGSYDPAVWNGWGERGDAVYFHNPVDYVGHLHGDHLEWLRSRLFVELVVGRGAYEEHPTRALSSTHQLAGLLASKGLPHELAVWGEEWPHDWSSWRAQLATYLPRFT